MKKLLLLSYLALAGWAGGQTKISDLPALPGSGAATSDVLPIVDVSAGAAGSKKITLAELFSTPVPWQGPVVAGQYGGTGVANTGKSISLGGNLTTTGAGPLTLATSGATSVTLPTSGTLATTESVDGKADADGGNIADAAAFRGAIGTKNLSSPFWKPLKRVSVYQDSGKPVVLRSVTLGDSWNLNATSALNANFGNFGEIYGPGRSDKTSVTEGNVRATPFFQSYNKTPFEGRYITMTGAGSVVFGGDSGANRLTASGKVIVVMYERVSGGGTLSVQYETGSAGVFSDVGVVGNWQAASGSGALSVISQINTGSGAGASEFAIATFTLPAAATPRIRCTWVSGTCNVYAAGVVGTADLEPVGGTSRQGHVDCNLGIGSLLLSYYNDVPQATWNTLFGWLKPDFVFVRELSEIPAAEWGEEFGELMPKLATAYSQSAVVCIGAHPTDNGTEERNAEIDHNLEVWCAENNAAFIPLRQYFPSYATYSSIGMGDSVHMSVATIRYAEKVIWDHLMPFHHFALDGGATAPVAGFRPLGNGTGAREWWATYDSNIPGQIGRLGIRDKGKGTDNYGTAIEFRSRAGNSGFQIMATDGNAFWHTDAIGRTMYGGSVEPTRIPGSPGGGGGSGAHFEFYGANPGLVTLSLQAQSTMTQNMMEWRTGATPSVGGTLAGRLDSGGNLKFDVAGLGLTLKTGSNARIGSGQALTAGVATVANTGVTANTHVSLTKMEHGGTGGTSYVVKRFAQARATASVSGGAVTGFTVTASGESYSSAPSVTISGSGTGATGTAVLTNGKVTSITLGSGGSGYGSAPTVTLGAPPTAVGFTITAIDASGATVTTDTSTFDWQLTERQ